MLAYGPAAMSKHWQPPRGKIVRVRPVGDWARIQSYGVVAGARRLPPGAWAGLLVIAAACVGVAIGAYQVLGPRDIVADEVAVPQALDHD